jgi:hypothetical protein
VRVRDGTIFENTQKRKREMKKRKEKKGKNNKAGGKVGREETDRQRKRERLG